MSSRFHLGLMYHRINDYKDALKCFSKVLAKIADDKTVYIARGLVYQDMGNHQLAIKDFNAALKTKRRNYSHATAVLTTKRHCYCEHDKFQKTWRSKLLNPLKAASGVHS